MDGLTGHDEANGLLSRLRELAWKQRVFPWRWCGRDMNLTNRLHVIQRLKMRGATLPLLIYLHGKVFNEGDGRLNFPHHSGVQNQCLLFACRRIIVIYIFFRKSNKCTWMYECNFITQESLTCFGHPRGHPQGGNNKNTNTIIMGRKHSIVKTMQFFVKY